MPRNPLTVEKLPVAVHAGDWHDKPLKWTVAGPGYEAQHFSTKRDAMAWRALRFRSASFDAALRASISKASRR